VRNLAGVPAPTILATIALVASGAVASEDRPLRLEAGGHLAMAFGDVCRQDSIDTVGCQQAFYAGGHLGAAWRPLRFLALGARFGWAAGRNEKTDTITLHSQLVSTAAELRASLGLVDVDPWIALDFGVVWARDTASSSSGSSEVVARSSPLLGAGVGIDLPLASWLSLAPEVRYAYFRFDRTQRSILSTWAPDHHEQGALLVGFSLVFRPSL
jgi:hypothetical protein